MSCCNSKLPEENMVKKSDEFTCPKCATKGVKTKLITIENCLLNEFKNQINNKDIYKFCNNPNCDVVYFSYEDTVFFKDNLKEKITLKDGGLDVKTCYCFNITKGDIVDEIKSTGDCNVVEIIKAKMKDPGCFCETSNPQGACCLANNISFIKEAKNKLSTERE